jgi:hypothetical protein
MKIRGKRFLVVLLSVLMLLSQMSMVSFAVTGNDQTPAPTGETGQVRETGNEADGQPAATGDDTAVQNEAGGDVVTQDAPKTGTVESVVSDTKKFSFWNRSGADIRIKGKQGGGSYTKVIASGGEATNIELDSLKAIEAKEPILIKEGSTPKYSVETLEDHGYVYRLDFSGRDIKYTGDVNMVIGTDEDVRLVFFEANGGRGEMDPQIFHVGEADELDKNYFKNGDEEFIGWATTPGGDVSLADGAKVTFKEEYGNATIYAKWHAHKWNVYNNDTKSTAYIHCDNENQGCPYKGTCSIQLDAKDKVYDGYNYLRDDDDLKVNVTGNVPEGFVIPDETYGEYALEYYKGDTKLDEAPKDAGEYKAVAHILYNGKDTGRTIEDTFKITARPLAVKADDKTKMVGQDDPELTYAVTSELGHGDKAEDVLSGKLTRDTGEYIGNYAIRKGDLKVINSNYSLTFTKGTLSISANRAVVTKAPVAKELVYSGENQALVEAGEAVGGTMVYYVGETCPTSYTSEAWTTTVPEASDAKPYYVWYGVRGKVGYDDVAPALVEGVSIAPKTLGVEWTKTKLTYNGQEQKPTAKAIDPETKEAVAGVTLDVTGAKKDANTGLVGYTAKATIAGGSSNYVLDKKAAETEFRINPKFVKITWDYEKDNPYKYDGQSHAPTATINEGQIVGGDNCGLKYILFDKSVMDLWALTDSAVEPGDYLALAYPDNSNYTTFEITGNKTLTDSSDAAEALNDEDEPGINVQEQEFKITRGELTTYAKIDGWKYGEKPNTPSVTNNPDKSAVTYKYYKKVNDNFEPVDDGVEPKDFKAGEYLVAATVAESEHYEKTTVWATFAVSRATDTLTVSMEDWTYGETASTPDVKGNIGDGELTYSYVGTMNGGRSYRDTKVPEEAGSYTLTVTAAATADSDKMTASTSFMIKRAEPKLRMTGKDWTYGQDIEDPAEYFKVKSDAKDFSKGALVFSYKESDGEEIPIDAQHGFKDIQAGLITLYVACPQTNNYLADYDYDIVNVDKAPLPFKIKAVEKKLVYQYDPATGRGTPYALTYIDGNVPEGVTIKYKTGIFAKYTTDAPVKRTAYNHKIWYIVDGGRNYESIGSLDRILPDLAKAIEKDDFSDVEVTVASEWQYGKYDESYGPKLKENTYPEDHTDYSFVYALYDPDEVEDINEVAGFTDEFPEEPGHYVVRAQFDGGDNYKESMSKPASFEITKASFESEVNISDWTYGEYDEEENGPSVSSNPDDTDVTYYFASIPSDESEPAYIEFDPEDVSAYDAGTYMMYATIKSGDHYAACKTAEKEFTIRKAVVYPSARIVSWLYGAEGNDPFIKGLPDDFEGTISYEYAPIGEDTYSPLDPENKAGTYPTEVGIYVIRAEIKPDKNGNYACGKYTKPFPFAVIKTAGKGQKPTAVEGLTFMIGDNDRPVEWPLVTAGKTADGHYEYALTNSDSRLSLLGKNFSEDIPKGATAGKYYVWYKFVGDESHVSDTFAKGPIEVTIAKATPQVIEIKPDLTYNGKEQELVKLSVDGGTIKYAHRTSLLGIEYYDEKVPTAKNAGTHTVKYKVEGNSNYNDLAPVEISNQIKKADIHPEIELGDWWFYGLNGFNQPKIKDGTNPGNGRVTYKYRELLDSETSTKMPTDVGAYVVSADVEETANYNGGSNSGKVFVILPVPLYTSPSPKALDLTYNGEPQQLVKPGKIYEGLGNIFGEIQYKLGDGEYSKEIPTATDAGTYEVSYRIDTKGNDNFVGMGSGVVSGVEIKKASIEPEVSIEGWTFGKYAGQMPTVEGNPAGADVTYSYKAEGAENYLPFTDTVASTLDAGNYELKAEVAESGNYLGGSATTEFTVDKDYPKVNVKGADGLVYNGEEHVLITSASTDHGTLLFKQRDGSWAETWPAATSAHRYNLEYKVEGDSNFYGVSGEVEVRIAPVEITGFTWTGKDSYEFDGGRHGVTATAEGVLEGDNIGVSLDNAEASAIGDYAASVVKLTGAKAENYRFDKNLPSAKFRWSIVKPAVDPDAEARARAEAAWNGTYSANIPNAKSVKAKAGKKSFTVKWKKLSKKQRRKFNKIEIQYCSDGSFNRATTVVKEVGKNRKSVKIKGLVKGSVYYVRVRNIKYSYDTKYVSNWSKVKTVKVK